MPRSRTWSLKLTYEYLHREKKARLGHHLVPLKDSAPKHLHLVPMPLAPRRPPQTGRAVPALARLGSTTGPALL